MAVTKDNAVANYHVGMEFQEQGKYDLAVTHFWTALEDDPGYADAHFSLGFILYAMGKKDEAREQYQTAIRLQPWHAQAHTSLGVIYWMRGDHDAMLGLRIDFNLRMVGAEVALPAGAGQARNFHG